MLGRLYVTKKENTFILPWINHMSIVNSLQRGSSVSEHLLLFVRYELCCQNG